MILRIFWASQNLIIIPYSFQKAIQTSFSVLPSTFHDQPAEPGDGM